MTSPTYAKCLEFLEGIKALDASHEKEKISMFKNFLKVFVESEFFDSEAEYSHKDFLREMFPSIKWYQKLSKEAKKEIKKLTKPYR